MTLSFVLVMLLQVRNCRLVNLADLALGHDYVRGKIADYLNHLISLGVFSFRDAKLSIHYLVKVADKSSNWVAL